MTWNTFAVIRRFMHLTDNSKLRRKGQHGWHPLQKLGPFLAHFNKKFKSLYTLGKHIVVDDASSECVLVLPHTVYCVFPVPVCHNDDTHTHIHEIGV